jgi:fatty acid-binding protein DegV
MGYLIFSDVSLDIDQEFAKKHDVRFVPMEYVLGDDTFFCEQPEDDYMIL